MLRRHFRAQRAAALPLASPNAGQTVCVITCANYGHFLPACLTSLLAQTLPFREIILVDDASTDDTAEVAARYPVRYLRGEWRNFTDARNAGAALVTDPPAFWLFVDADDTLPPGYHQALREAMADPSVGVAYSRIRLCDPEGRPGALAPYVREYDYDRLRYGNPANAASLVRREVWQQVGPWEHEDSGTGHTDWLLWLKITRAGWRMQLCPEAELQYRVHPDSMLQRAGRGRAPGFSRGSCIIRSVGANFSVEDRFRARLLQDASQDTDPHPTQVGSSLPVNRRGIATSPESLLQGDERSSETIRRIPWQIRVSE